MLELSASQTRVDTNNNPVPSFMQSGNSFSIKARENISFYEKSRISSNNQVVVQIDGVQRRENINSVLQPNRDQSEMIPKYKIFKTIEYEDIDNSSKQRKTPTDSNISSEPPGSIVTQRNTHYHPTQPVADPDKEELLFNKKVASFQGSPLSTEVYIK